MCGWVPAFAGMTQDVSLAAGQSRRAAGCKCGRNQPCALNAPIQRAQADRIAIGIVNRKQDGAIGE